MDGGKTQMGWPEPNWAITSEQKEDGCDPIRPIGKSIMDCRKRSIPERLRLSREQASHHRAEADQGGRVSRSREIFHLFSVVVFMLVNKTVGVFNICFSLGDPYYFRPDMLKPPTIKGITLEPQGVIPSILSDPLV